MKNSFSSTRLLMAAYAALAVSACSSLDHLPFIGESSPAAPDQPKDATRYLCKGGSSFYVRMLGKENAVWLIFPDREVRFEKSATNSPGQYSNGSAVLEMNGSQASIKDEADSKYAECKVAGK